MAGLCIPANPDISGIGVRTAIYAQNLLCFAPVVSHLWDGKISADEMSGVKDQSIGMLAIAFAILISTIIQASSGQLITKFQGAVVLQLSWMNNTSTFIWFLLYVHHRSKGDEPVLATWSSWARHLLSPLKSGSNRDTKLNQKTSKRFQSVLQQLWKLVSRAPVLTLGSVHLSLMACVGVWLWSNPSKFGVSIPCYPSLAIVGGAVSFSSSALRIWSLFIYSLLLIPGINLVPGFLFFLSLHILYNKSRRRHPRFWTRCGHVLDAVREIPHALRNIPQTVRWIPVDGLRGRRALLPSDEEAQIEPILTGEQSAHPTSVVNPVDSEIERKQPTPSHAESIHLLANPSITSRSPSSFDVHTTFVIVGLVSLAIINIIFLVDIELTLSRNQPIQVRGEDEWGFGQVLALLLLVVPLRDFVRSITDIRKKVRDGKLDLQRRFEKVLADAIGDDSFVSGHFRGFIEQGADPNIQLGGSKFMTLLQFAAYKGNIDTVNYLLEEKGVDPDVHGGDCGTALQAASSAGNLEIVRVLLAKNANANLLGGMDGSASQAASQRGYGKIAFLLFDNGSNLGNVAVQPGILLVMEFLKDSNKSVRDAAVDALTSIATHAELRDDIRTVIPDVLKCLVAPDLSTRLAANKVLSGIAAYVELRGDIRLCIHGILECVKDSDEFVRSAAITALSSMVAHTESCEEIRLYIPVIVECAKDSNDSVRMAAINALSSIAAHSEFPEEIRLGIPAIRECLKDNTSWVTVAALKALSSIAAHAELREEIRLCIPGILEHVEAGNWLIRPEAVNALSSMVAHAHLREGIRLHIPTFVKCLKDSDPGLRSAAIEALSRIAAHAELREDIRLAIPSIMEWLEHSEKFARSHAIKALSSLSAHAELREEIRLGIPATVEFLKDANQLVRSAAVHALLSMVAHAEMREEIRLAIPAILECLKDSDFNTRQATIAAVSSIAAQAELREEIRLCIPSLLEFLKDMNMSVRSAALEALSGIAAHAELREDIRLGIPAIMECLKHSDSDTSSATVAVISRMAAHDIRLSIPGIVAWLKGEHWTRPAAINAFSNMATHAELHEEIRLRIPAILECLKDSHERVRSAAIHALLSMAVHADLREQIRPGIPAIIDCLKDSDKSVRETAIKSLLAHELHEHIRLAIPSIVEWLKDSELPVRKAATDALASLMVHADFQQTQQMLIRFLLAWIIDCPSDTSLSILQCLSRIRG